MASSPYAAGSQVNIDLQHGQLMISPIRKKRYTLAELVAQCDPSLPLLKQEQEWLDAPAVGLEADAEIPIGTNMEVKIITFPETKVVAIEHFGSPMREYDTVKKLIAWKLENRLLDQLKYRNYGIHYTNPHITPPSEHRADFCLSFDGEVGPNPYGIRNMVIPERRCALARDIGSRANNKAAAYLYETWLPLSGESPGDFPMFFHYVNVGPHVREDEMITDVYLPLR